MVPYSHHGVDPKDASTQLHEIKQKNGIGAGDDVAIGGRGDVYNNATGEHVGTIVKRGRVK